MIAERFLSADYAPAAVAQATGLEAATIERIAAEIATAAFKTPVVVDEPWVDAGGTRHAACVGRPVSMHAMRGISAHANGFQTCRMLHLLQVLIGSIDTPGGFRFKPPYPKPVPPPPKPRGRANEVAPNTPLPGPPLGFVASPHDLIVDDDGRALRIDKAYSWDAPLAAHGLIQSVIGNAAAGDPYPIDVLFLYMANMAWNSSMNIPKVIDDLTAIDPETGDYKIGKIIYSDAYDSETVAYADLILPDTTYLERWDCISLLDRPISDADGAADAIRHPIVAPDRDVRPFQTVLLDLGARLGLPGFVDEEGRAKYPGGYEDYIVNHQRAPDLGPLAGWRGSHGERFGTGAPNPRQLERYIDHGGFCRAEIPAGARFYKHANRAYLDWAVHNGFLGKAEPITFELYSERLQTFRLAADGHGPIQPPEGLRERVRIAFDPIPFWFDPMPGALAQSSSSARAGQTSRKMFAVTQRPMAMYHSWGSQNAWLRQIHAENRLYIHHRTAATLGLADDDWVRLESSVGVVLCQVRLMEGVNPDTVWTWNAIAKRAGTWGLDPGAPEANRSFLLNHLIADLLPARVDGQRFLNADAVTGQAAWYDLVVEVTRVEPPSDGCTVPQFNPLELRVVALEAGQ